MQKWTFKVKSYYVKTYDEPEFNRKEILRYAGAKDSEPEIEELIDECINELQGKLSYKVCCSELPLLTCEDSLDLTFTKVKSHDLKKNLMGCDSFVLFAATVGIEIDRLIIRYSRISPVRALIFQAIGAERIETLANLFNNEVKDMAQSEGKQTAPRFSPGYGDLPLDVQKDIFSYLDCPRKIGLSLNESLLMSPSKSVTAFIGIGNKINVCKKSSCAACTKENCDFRR